MQDSKYYKIRYHCHHAGEYRGAAHSICNLKYSEPKILHIVSHNYYHFIIKELTEKFKNCFTYLEENTEKYVTFTVPIKKEVTRIDNNGEKITENIS